MKIIIKHTVIVHRNHDQPLTLSPSPYLQWCPDWVASTTSFMLAKKSGAVAEVEGPADPPAVPTVEELLLNGHDEHSARNIAGQEQARFNRGDWPYVSTKTSPVAAPATSQQEDTKPRSNRF
jgi:hypothetical protein